MKAAGLPISAKITGLFILNLVLLVVAGFFLLRDSWSVEAAPAFRSNKLDLVAEPMFRQLEQTPLQGWDDILAEASHKHGLTFLLYSTHGPRLAGPDDFLPGNIHGYVMVDRPKKGPPKRPQIFGDTPSKYEERPDDDEAGPPDRPKPRPRDDWDWDEPEPPQKNGKQGEPRDGPSSEGDWKWKPTDPSRSDEQRADSRNEPRPPRGRPRPEDDWDWDEPEPPRKEQHIASYDEPGPSYERPRPKGPSESAQQSPKTTQPTETAASKSIAVKTSLTGPNGEQPVITSPEGYWSFAFGQIQHSNLSERVVLLTKSSSPTGDGFYSDHMPLYGIVAGLVLGSVLLWLPFVRSTTRSLKQMHHAASKMSHGDFSTRVNEKRGDELGALGRSVNHMADQIGCLIDGQKRMLDDIAHELSSPIARMQAVVGILENTSQSTGSEQQQRYVARLDDELQHMGQLVQELLSLSKASLKRTIELRPVQVEPLLQRVIQREQHHSEGITLEVPEGLTIMSDPELLSRAVGNVLRNALRYARQDGPVHITAKVKDEIATICISDQGPGVPESALPYLFDAFYRPDVARTRETGGSGLGLAIAKTCAEATNGTIRAANRLSGGLEVAITQTVLVKEPHPQAGV